MRQCEGFGIQSVSLLWLFSKPSGFRLLFGQKKQSECFSLSFGNWDFSLFQDILLSCQYRLISRTSCCSSVWNTTRSETCSSVWHQSVWLLNISALPWQHLILMGVSFSKVRGQQHIEGPLTCKTSLLHNTSAFFHQKHNTWLMATNVIKVASNPHWLKSSPCVLGTVKNSP